MDYKDLVYVYDKNGKQFACPKDAIKNLDQLSEEEKSKCVDFDFVIGTERV